MHAIGRSCGDRHCPSCQRDKAEAWLANQTDRRTRAACLAVARERFDLIESALRSAKIISVLTELKPPTRKLLRLSGRTNGTVRANDLRQ